MKITSLAGLAGTAAVVIGLGLPAQTAHAAGAALSAAKIHNNATSTGQAGYEVTSAPASSSASATFNVPSLTCTSTTSGIAPGAFVFTTTSASLASVFVTCQGGIPDYFGILLADGTETQTTFTPAAGDVITVSVTESATASKATLKDVTQKKSKTVKGPGGTPSVVLDGIDGLVSGSTQLPVPTFDKIVFKAAKEDGLTPEAASAVAVNMETSSAVLQIKTGALNAAGNHWTETFKHS